MTRSIFSVKPAFGALFQTGMKAIKNLVSLASLLRSEAVYLECNEDVIDVCFFPGPGSSASYPRYEEKGQHWPRRKKRRSWFRCCCSDSFVLVLPFFYGASFISRKRFRARNEESNLERQWCSHSSALAEGEKVNWQRYRPGVSPRYSSTRVPRAFSRIFGRKKFLGRGPASYRSREFMNIVQI